MSFDEQPMLDLAAFHAGKIEEAHAKLDEAWALKNTYDIAGDLGIIERKLGKLRAAAEHRP